MESAYIYVRVSTDEQKKTGYSLIEQEERLLNHCAINKIKVKGTFREDFSAKDFNRPEWKKLISVIKKNKRRPPENILFLKWDRFSRNIGFAYQMIGILKELNVQATAIDQPVDFEIPESIVTLAIYLSIPEAENTRRGRNCSDGMRRAKKMGRWPAKAPVGYSNQTCPEGKTLLVPKYPEADHVKWAFEQFEKGLYSITQVRKMAHLNGFQCGRNNFWRLLHNPIYYGIIIVPATKSEEIQFVKGIHEPIIPKHVFDTVQQIFTSRRRPKNVRGCRIPLFPLRGFLHCPWCNRTLTGSISQGRNAKYRYYHCSTIKCKGRFSAEVLDKAYEDQLKRIQLSPKIAELLEMVLQDENVASSQKEYHTERRDIMTNIEKQQLLIAKARKLLITEKIGCDDFSELKREYQQAIGFLNSRLDHVTQRLINLSFQDDRAMCHKNFNLANCYKKQDIAGKRHFLNYFTPTSINPSGKSLRPLKVNDSIIKIIAPS